MSEQLKPCPFCGGKDVETRTSSMSWLVDCYTCDARGPLCGSEDRAIEEWNDRAGEER